MLCHTQELPGAWVKGQSAGGCRNNSGFPSNPKFWLRVCEPSEVYLGVLQRPRVRTAGRPGRDYQAVGLHLWKVAPPGTLPRGTWRPEPPEPPKSPFHPHPVRSESTGCASLPRPGCVFWPKANSREAAWLGGPLL